MWERFPLTRLRGVWHERVSALCRDPPRFFSLTDTAQECRKIEGQCTRTATMQEAPIADNEVDLAPGGTTGRFRAEAILWGLGANTENSPRFCEELWENVARDRRAPTGGPRRLASTPVRGTIVLAARAVPRLRTGINRPVC